MTKSDGQADVGSGGLTLQEAAHKLRMSVELVRWFTRYSPKGDGRKLRRNADGRFDEDELEAFDAYLWESWPDKYPGSGILRELQLESRGRCGHCKDACDVRETAHIDRLNEELKHHCQHPHNLIELCRNCHGRYDTLKTITNETVRHCKKQLTSALMEAVDRDVLMQKEIRRACSDELQNRVAAEVQRQLSVLSVAQRMTYHAESVVTGSAQSLPLTTQEAGARLQFLSGSLASQSPITSALLHRYATQVSRAALPAPESNVEEPFDDWDSKPGACLRCSGTALIDEVACADCGEVPEWPEHVSRNEDGTYTISKEVWRTKEPDTETLSCADCGSGRFEVEFGSLCDYCSHMSAKD
jgi:hypothetical protein